MEAWCRLLSIHSGELMERRTFLTYTLAASAFGIAGTSAAAASQPDAAETTGREFYQLRRYSLLNGPQRRLCNDFFRDALIPALNRLDITPVGVFDLTIGPETPSIYVLMPSLKLETLVTVETKLGQDAEYVKAGAAFLTAPATQPAFVRMDSSLLEAFEKMPRLKLPAATASKGPRVFELRSYEGPSDQDHRLKVEMMQSGEEKIFADAGFSQVFYGDMVVGPRMPNLTYMLSYESVADRDKRWGAFISDPAWKKLSSDPRYAFEEIVSKITNVILTPTSYSQI
jgi:NIPSNAP